MATVNGAQENPPAAAMAATASPATKWRRAPPRGCRARPRPLRPSRPHAVCPRGAAVAAAASLPPSLPAAVRARRARSGARSGAAPAAMQAAAALLRRCALSGLRAAVRRPAGPAGERPPRAPSRPPRPRPGAAGSRGARARRVLGGGARPVAPCPCNDPAAALQGRPRLRPSAPPPAGPGRCRPRRPGTPPVSPALLQPGGTDSTLGWSGGRRRPPRASRGGDIDGGRR